MIRIQESRRGFLTDRLQISIVAGVVVAAVPWFFAPLGRMVRRGNGPDDLAVLLWWPVHSWTFVLPFVVSVLAGLVVSRLIFIRRNAVNATLLGLAAIAIAIVLATALSWSSIVKVYPDKVELTQSRFPASVDRISVRLSRATSVETYCYVESGRRKRSIVHLVYLVHLPDVGTVDLGAALLNSERHSDSRYGVLRRLDEGVLHSVPRVGDDAPAGECLRLLHRQIGGDQFTIARRLMGIDDQTYLRLYAEPYESWNGTADRR